MAHFLHPQDNVRRTHFYYVYNWAQNVLQKAPQPAFFIAKKSTLKKYPIVPGETFYPIK